MRVFLVSVLALSGFSIAHAVEETTALGALKLLPKGAASRLALIEARESKAAPERWHILVHDPEEDSGVHEYVIAGGEVVASRSVSQFAETLKPADVIGADAVKVDSDRAVKLAQQYAKANSVPATAFDFELKRDGEGAAPLWKVTCLDARGSQVGQVVLTATKGVVIAHDGFPNEPGQEKALEKKPAAPVAEKAPEKKPAPEPAPESEKPAETAEPAPVAEEKPPTPPKKSAPAPREAPPRDRDSRREPPPENRPGFFHRAGGKLQKFFTGRDTLGR